MEPIEVIVRVFASFVVLLFLTRLMGKKQVSELTFFNYITGITIGAVAATITIDASIDFFDGLISLFTWTSLILLVSYLTLKSPKARILLNGQPTVVIKNGEILERAMADIRLTMEDLRMLLREENIFSTQDVDYAVLEPNGQLSVLKKMEKQNVTNKDLNVTTITPLYIPTEIILEGKVVGENLTNLNLTSSWLEKQLNQAGVRIQDVFYAEIQSDGNLFIDKKS
ncbi:DUF421 domain-containing protein [Bacillus sp. 1NLA3E]|uniref:DUF421 domain-containing protein n=1 Tax=Bacillus sp. 1NLA3E TaxID=666686 RepID=UPI000247EBA9|nr:DUF421 domain-containing protein [Bacillus sp. 1NLA3E]AGK53419.1 hypothetical protein B1NLA3E_08285 [Bacillus sp. 1NLA3E]